MDIPGQERETASHSDSTGHIQEVTRPDILVDEHTWAEKQLIHQTLREERLPDMPSVWALRGRGRRTP